jgi:hypothetical protein
MKNKKKLTTNIPYTNRAMAYANVSLSLINAHPVGNILICVVKNIYLQSVLVFGFDYNETLKLLTTDFNRGIRDIRDLMNGRYSYHYFNIFLVHLTCAHLMNRKY